MLAFTYYAAGPMQRFPADGGPFALYWFAEPPFDLPAVAADISAWFAQAWRLFRDPGGSYRVFVRANPYPAGGGTALRRSFMFGWGIDRPVSAAELQGLLAHEITHNCPRLDGGATIVPPTSSFGPCLKPVPYHGPRFELGSDDFAAGKVRGLVADSNAARAGVQEGDEIVDRGDVEAARRDPARELVIKLRRGADLHEIHYLPRGAQVEGWRWTPAGPPLAQCRY